MADDRQSLKTSQEGKKRSTKEKSTTEDIASGRRCRCAKAKTKKSSGQVIEIISENSIAEGSQEKKK